MEIDTNKTIVSGGKIYIEAEYVQKLLIENTENVIEQIEDRLREGRMEIIKTFRKRSNDYTISKG